METPYTGEAQGTAEMYTGHQEGRYDFYCDQKTISRGPDGNAGSEPNLERAEAFEPTRSAARESYREIFPWYRFGLWVDSLAWCTSSKTPNMLFI